ncbi:DNA-protecting protein DprA [Neisseria sp. N95_16]|uniref:DNA-protecting protein DprA n=1 Tax=Neisseria brasiliensis TaxID=2666100 RepID=A0A5Q3RZK9_9NEIS|nr:MULTISPECIES: DNA-processing protein DprA [Neisseria]MRN38179.1 DNA-protecting protein DprA [Neisseria brasiliensis]PJO09076.1 DNA-protecting protein DprA [Neisseria sp. N95_16]PJO77311.1 DNA-protecting protein DprA [Neisseria sp. N177_16]QGL25179.1 DNA-protecting protein DprA [Neisseria brasiliensis]
MNDNERFAWVQLALTPYIGAESFLLLLQHFGSAEAALAAPSEIIAKLVRHKQAVAAWQHADKCDAAKAAAEAALNWAQQKHCRLLLLQDDDFPDMLTEGITPPPLLFLRGNSDLLHKPSAAIVGSRHATPQAMRIARDFGMALSEQGIPVVSGMAAGIDTAAHQGALLSDGGTIAVWGTGIDRIYPPSNKQLAYEIAERGLIISEFPLDTRPYAGNFPRRNRLIAALSRLTLVVEAAVESGSLITAKLAAEMGREVMAVPGSIDNPHSKGCHKLIKEGAKLVESLEDIVQECPQLLQNTPLPSYSIYKRPQNTLAAESKAKPETSAKPLVETDIRPSETQNTADDTLLNAMGYDAIHPDTLAELLNWPAADVYAQLLEYELDGVIAPLAGGRYQRIKT